MRSSYSSLPRTTAARKAIQTHGSTLMADLTFLEKWQERPTPSVAHILRASQIRRANPDLVHAICSEITEKCTQ